jgi:serine/threonine protein kinase
MSKNKSDHAQRGVHQGDVLSEFTITKLLAEGSYSWVYEGTRDIRRKAFKVAKPIALSGTPGESGRRHTAALICTTGGISDIRPDPVQILSHQIQWLCNLSDPGLVKAEEFVFVGGDLAYGIMEFVPGQTLSELKEESKVATSVLVNLAHTLDRLSGMKAFDYHGDIKPDNIIVTADNQVKLIDPGYFGALDGEHESYSACCVTTPGYYPLLEPDDLLALGIMVAEIILGQHPLDGCQDLNEIRLDNIDPAVIELVKEQQIVGRYFLTPLLESCNPENLAKIDKDSRLKDIALKAIRLRLDGTMLRADAGYANFLEVARALEGIQSLGFSAL